MGWVVGVETVGLEMGGEVSSGVERSIDKIVRWLRRKVQKAGSRGGVQLESVFVCRDDRLLEL